MKNISIRELASTLNLSVSTISKALHDSYEISDETKQRVLETAERLNYIPNPYASSLRGRKSKNIALVIPEVADSFFSLAINGIESVAKQHGYHVLICLTHESFENEKAFLKEFQGGRVDGVLMSVSSETSQAEHINSLISNGLPIMFFDRAVEDVDTAQIITDDFESGYRATSHLIERGCSRIAFMGISRNLSINSKRLEGYIKSLSNHKLPIVEKNILLCTHDSQENLRLTKKLLQRKTRPDGIVAAVEKLAPAVYQACSDLNLSIPQDVKVICFSNLETASILNPSLTTITQPAFDMGRMAATMLFTTLKKNKSGLTKESIVIPSILVARDSTLRC